MSLQSLPRRISLDFRDIFSKGFAFDTIKATAHISNGVLKTSDFTMIGAAASVLIDGETNLQTESQNLHVAGAAGDRRELGLGCCMLLLANPAIGIGTLLAQWPCVIHWRRSSRTSTTSRVRGPSRW